MKPTKVRYVVLFFACSLSLLTYLDRVCISRVQGDMQRDLGFSDKEMGWVFGAFLLGYCLFEIPGGWMGDRWGARRVITRIVIAWSIFTALTGMIDQILNLEIFASVVTPTTILMGMLIVRFLFGCGEAGAYPNLARVVGSWFPFRERAFAQGSIWMWARLGGAIAPLVIGRLSVWVGWRQAFCVLGAVGVGWCVVFFWWFRNSPREKPSCNEAEVALIEVGKSHMGELAHAMPPWSILLTSVNLFAVCVAGFMVSFGWYFYPTWQPRFLKDVYNVSYANSELITGLPFLCGACGAFLGGKISDVLVRRVGRRWGRSGIGAAGFFGAGVCVCLTGFATSQTEAVALLCLAFFINDLSIPAIWAVSTDIGGKYAGTVAGIMNTAGAIGGFISPVLTPYILAMLPEEWEPVERWRVVFIGLSGAWFIGTVAWFFVDASKTIVPVEDAATKAKSLPTPNEDSPPA